jgi:uncharacterized protein
MSPTLIPLFLAVGMVTGICAGLFGIGGGVILVPLLVLFFGYSQATASGISLTALLLPVGLLGVLQYWRAGRISGGQIRMGFLIAIGVFAGTYVGARIGTMLPDQVLRRSFAIFMALVAVKLWVA